MLSGSDGTLAAAIFYQQILSAHAHMKSRTNSRFALRPGPDLYYSNILIYIGIIAVESYCSVQPMVMAFSPKLTKNIPNKCGITHLITRFIIFFINNKYP